jgi:hypothetical protein
MDVLLIFYDKIQEKSNTTMWHMLYVRKEAEDVPCTLRRLTGRSSNHRFPQVIELATGSKMIVQRRFPTFGYHTKCTWYPARNWLVVVRNIVTMPLPGRNKETGLQLSRRKHAIQNQLERYWCRGSVLWEI